ncbi:MAG TPA: ABC transporter ATP-binding protein [Cyclobacteriaceae bacterium]|nr:ABC transporter ATP-binding protein [Cyclobacteriaceae bacterium]
MEVIRVSSLSKRYHKHQVLQNIDLTIQSGELIGYIGPNGAGKSTTIKILCGLIPEFEGDVQVLGLDIKKNTLDIKRKIGYIPENAALYETLTPIEYLLFVGQLYQLSEASIKQKANELLKLFDLDKAKESRMTTFSKGMKQKVLLISGLLHNPEIIFLDEPLSGLDANAVILVKEILTQLKRSGKTIFYSSHIMEVVEKLSDRIIILNGGQIIANGSFQELHNRAQGGSLEQIFTQLTGHGEQVTVANTFVDILKS